MTILDDIVKNEYLLTEMDMKYNIFQSMSNNDLSINMKESIFNSTKDILGLEEYTFTNESISNVLKSIIETFKKIVAKVWKAIIDLYKKIISYFKKDKDIDDVLNEISTEDIINKNVVNNLVQVDISLPKYLSRKSTDAIEYQGYFFKLMVSIRLNLYGSIVEYLTHVRTSIESKNIEYKSYKNFFKSYVSKAYNDDTKLASILYEVGDDIHTKAKSSKYILGYTKSSIGIYVPGSPISNIVNINNKEININVMTDQNKLKYHLENIRDSKEMMIREENDVNNILKGIDIIKKYVSRKLDDNNSDMALANYLKELSTTVPKLLHITAASNIHMYKNYKNNIINIYKASKTTL